MNFRKLEFEDIKTVKTALYSFAPNQSTDYTVTGLFLWRDYLDTHIAFENGDFYIYQVMNGRNLFLFPLCENPEPCLKKIIEHCKSNNLDFGFYPLTEENVKYFDNLNISYESMESEDYNDYLYNIEELANFRGKHFHTHKNHINKFDKEYEDFSFEKISKNNIHEIKDFLKIYTDEKFDGQIEDTERSELSRLPELLDNMDDYNVFGYCLKIYGVIQSFEIGEIVGDMYYSHVEKANRNIDGIYTKMVNLVAKDLQGKAVLMNREDDGGVEGLRASKRRYNPCGFVYKKIISVSP